MHEFAVFALTCHEKHEKFLSSHTRSIIFQDHQIKYMRAWLESVLLTAASFGCQAIYRRMSRRKKKCESCCCCCYSSSLLLFFSSSSLSHSLTRIVSKRSENGKFMAFNLSSVHSEREWEMKKKWTHFDIYCKLQLVDMTPWSIIYVIHYEIVMWSL